MNSPFGAWSLLPPVVAIVLAIATRRVVPSLLIGVAAGSLILHWPSPVAALFDLCETRLWASLADSDHLRVFAFTLLMGAMVGVISQAGGMHGIVDRLAHLANNRRRGQLTTALMGLVVFFDDYANTLLVGTTMRPLTDRLRISREKLAYLVDATAAPVAGLAIISTWVAGEIGFIQKGFVEAGYPEAVNGFDLFVASIPYRFYVLLALVFVFLVALGRRDFGPMLHAEREALAGRQHDRSLALVVDELVLDEHVPRRWFNALVPVLVVVVGTFLLLLATGWNSLNPAERVKTAWWELVAQGNSYVALVYASLAGLLCAVGLALAQRILTLRRVQQAAARGASTMLTALVILWLAWSLGSVTGKSSDDQTEAGGLGTGQYINAQLHDKVDSRAVPTIVFVLASVVAFCTGTSWGTMGILMPLAIDVTLRILTRQYGSTPSPDDPLMLATISGVLAGAIFGDHCSPISDTTVLSSRASGCDHIAHVRTQMPYAVAVAAVSIVCGTIPAGFGASPWWLLAAGAAVLVALLWLAGRRSDDAP